MRGYAQILSQVSSYNQRIPTLSNPFLWSHYTCVYTRSNISLYMMQRGIHTMLYMCVESSLYATYLISRSGVFTVCKYSLCMILLLFPVLFVINPFLVSLLLVCTVIRNLIRNFMRTLKRSSYTFFYCLVLDRF